MTIETLLSIAVALIMFHAGAPAHAGEQSRSPVDGGRVVAIDVLLLPDATMKQRALAANARLRGEFPTGYSLGRDQTAHISLVHRYVHERDLPAIEAALKRVLARENPTEWTLRATGYAYGVWSGLALTNIAVAPTPKVVKFEADVVKAVQPFAVPTGTPAAFHTTRELPKIEHEIVNYVAKFVPESSGAKYRPHVTIGVAHENYVKRLQAAPFETYTFRPAGFAIYQLGNFGTAQRKIWEWKP
ncbi:MAG TPA: 2'-5' RNA ligase family protein [Lacipirellulaceae bacterium]|nr:2'-5' RNA ligase family protein [Lacipirellulaceae bacterium]